MRLKVLLPVYTLLLTSAVKSQGVLFPNNNSALLLMNPSFAGTTGGTRLQSTAAARNLADNFRPYLAQTSGDVYLEEYKAGVGVALISNRFSFFSESTVHFSWAQHFELVKNRVKIIPALTIGYRRSAIDASVFSSASTPPVSQRIITNQGTIGASVLLEVHERLYLGVVINNIDLINDLPVKPNLIGSLARGLNASYNLQISKNDLLQAVVRVNKFMGFSQTQFGANYLHKKLLIGAGVNVSDAAYIQTGYKSDLICVSAQAEKIVSRLAGIVAPAFGINLAATLKGNNSTPIWKSIETW